MKPIIFNSEMVRAILEGRKTETRRIIKPQPPSNMNSHLFDDSGYGFFHEDLDYEGNCLDSYPEGDSGIQSRYQPGDVLYVRETCYAIRGDLYYKEDGSLVKNRISRRSWVFDRWRKSRKTPATISSIHMPKWAARLFLKVKSVHVERIHDISNKDVLNEGVEKAPNAILQLSRFRNLWESIHGPGAWERNDWVWVIKLERAENDY